jgi:4-alpha-glucanotransferase
MKTRGSGILLHITSLPSPHGVGDLGPSAYRFVEFLEKAGQRFWQILPLNPTGSYLGNSPYTSYSAFAGNPLLISLEQLRWEGLLAEKDLANAPEFPADRADYGEAIDYKGKLLRVAYSNFRSAAAANSEFKNFCEANSEWLDDYSLFAALKRKFKEDAWYEWPVEYRDREKRAMTELKEEMRDRIEMAKFFQFIFFRQWSNLKTYCRKKNIQIIGDIPIYTSIDSADVWSFPQMYKLDEQKHPLFVAGAPPDYFSETGQRWGNPVYRWDYCEQTGFDWWIKRIARNLELYDYIRLDHFRGFIAYWEIPVDEETAVNGKWVEAPATKFFETIIKRFPDIPLIAEDLGLITDDVREVMKQFGFPGMKVLLFAFGADLPANPYAPHNFMRNCVAYTGTHDNNTVQGWFQNEASDEDRKRFFDYIGHEVQQETIHWEWIRLALASVADLSVIPIQDALGLGEESRMNHPSHSDSNWEWRVLPDQLTEDLAKRLHSMCQLYRRI